MGKYISLQKQIEQTKETYYEVLAASSVGWRDGSNGCTPFIAYMLGVMAA